MREGFIGKTWRIRRRTSAAAAGAIAPPRAPTRTERALRELSDLDCWALIVLGGIVFLGTLQATFHAVWWTPDTLQIVLIALVAWAIALATAMAAGYGLVALRGMTLPAAETVGERERKVVEAAEKRAAERATTLGEIAQEWGDLVLELDDQDEASPIADDVVDAKGTPA